mgnify:CR=1 FL=1
MSNTFSKMRKGDTALVGFESVITRADFSTKKRSYYQFCIVTKVNREGRVITVQRKGDHYSAPVTLDCYHVKASDLHGVNAVHFLGKEQFSTIEDAKIALLTLIKAALADSAKEAREV